MLYVNPHDLKPVFFGVSSDLFAVESNEDNPLIHEVPRMIQKSKGGGSYHTTYHICHDLI